MATAASTALPPASWICRAASALYLSLDATAPPFSLPPEPPSPSLPPPQAASATAAAADAIRWRLEINGLLCTLSSEQLDLLLDVCARSDALFLGVIEAAHQRIAEGELATLTVQPPAGFRVPVAMVRVAGRAPSQLTMWVRDFVAHALARADASPTA